MALKLSILMAKQKPIFAVTRLQGIITCKTKESGYCHNNQISNLVLLTKNFRLIIINKESIYS
jgi:hypothetical protein